MGGHIYVGSNNGEIVLHDTSGTVEIGNNHGVIESSNFVPKAIDLDENMINRPYNPDTADYELIKFWLETCENGHDHQRGKLSSNDTRSGAAQSTHQMRLVDVVDQCVVENPVPRRYLSLSYTWGQVEQTKLTQASLPVLFTKGSLRNFNLPKTIRDAIFLVSKLGERFLWIDTLCIIQDSDDDKAYQIREMADIYSNSLLTILAVEGYNANAGLSRCNGQYQERPLEDGMLVNETVLASSGEPSRSNTVWTSRGWTYQETILSPRLLIVEGQRLIFNCEQIQFKEGKSPQRPITDPRFERLHVKLKRRNSLETYEHIVHVYSRLKLTYDDDVQNDFEGILSQLQPYLRSQVIFGLPETELVRAMSWRASKGERDEEAIILRRRKNLKTGEDWGPSWSWMGWVGGVHYDYALWPHEEMIVWPVTKDEKAQETDEWMTANASAAR